MTLLDNCLEESVGPAYVTLQSHRYGWRLFPNSIERFEFEATRAAFFEDTDAELLAVLGSKGLKQECQQKQLQQLHSRACSPTYIY